MWLVEFRENCARIGNKLYLTCPSRDQRVINQSYNNVKVLPPCVLVSVETLDSTLKIGCFEWMLQVFNPSDRYVQLTSYGQGWKDIFGSVHICPHPIQELPWPGYVLRLDLKSFVQLFRIIIDILVHPRAPPDKTCFQCPDTWDTIPSYVYRSRRLLHATVGLLRDLCLFGRPRQGDQTRFRRPGWDTW